MVTHTPPITHQKPPDATRVLLAAEPNMFRSLLHTWLSQVPGITAFVERSADTMDILLAVANTRSSILVLSWAGAPEQPEICSQLFHSFPEVVVLGLRVDDGGACIFRATYEPEWLPPLSPSDFLAAIRRCRQAAVSSPMRILEQSSPV